MSKRIEPAEEYDGTITVRVLADDRGRERIECSCYENAIELAKRKRESATVVKIEDRDGDVVFTSAEMDIRDWEIEWERAKRGLSVDADERECPYGNVACFADDLCVRCKMDEVQEQS